jgi:hypothetical protein
LIDVIEKGLMDESVPYDDIIKITGYFESYEEEMIKNILHERRS